jgi:multiple sugar transport system permease protein
MSAPTLVPPVTDAAPPARQAGVRIGGVTGAFWLFVGPFVVGLVVFVYLPIVWSVVLSFSRAQNTVTPGDWVGLQNYIDLLQPGPFLDSLITFTIFAAFIVPLTFALSLGLALLLNGVRVMRTFFRSVYFLPTACSYVVASLVWKLSIFVRFGLANTVLGWFGVENIAWLATTDHRGTGW